jgi:hypothetical protein
MMHIFGRLLQKMKGKAQSAAAPDSGQRADCVHRIFKQSGRIILFI